MQSLCLAVVMAQHCNDLVRDIKLKNTSYSCEWVLRLLHGLEVETGILGVQQKMRGISETEDCMSLAPCRLLLIWS